MYVVPLRPIRCCPEFDSPLHHLEARLDRRGRATLQRAAWGIVMDRLQLPATTICVQCAWHFGLFEAALLHRHLRKDLV